MTPIENWRDNLSSLPEEPYGEAITFPNGHTEYRRIIPRFVPCQMRGDDPACFVDSEGAWMVVYGLEGGPYKRRMP